MDAVREFLYALVVNSPKTLRENMKGVDVNGMYPLAAISLDTPLNYACAKGYEDIVDILLACPEIDVNGPGSCGTRPLVSAILNHNDAIAAKLIDDPRVDLSVIEGAKTALWVLAERGAVVRSLALLKRLLARGPSLITDNKAPFIRWPGISKEVQVTACEVAQIQGYTQFSELLKRYQADPFTVLAELRQELENQ